MSQLQATGPGRFSLLGALNLETVTAIRRDGLRQLAGAVAGSLRVDLAAVTDVDSGGLAMLVDWLAWANNAGRVLAYENPPPALLALARISDVSALLSG